MTNHLSRVTPQEVASALGISIEEARARLRQKHVFTYEEAMAVKEHRHLQKPTPFKLDVRKPKTVDLFRLSVS